MKRAAVLLMPLLIVACHRTDLGQTIHCGDGALAIVNNNALCVYVGQPNPECPEALPFPEAYAGSGFCAIEESPPPPLLAAALAQLDDAGPPDAAPTVDAGLSIIDARFEE